MNKKSAISAINKHGILLVFPIDNAIAPRSLWSVAHPRSKMLWEWDESGDDRVSKMWHLREELSRSRQVVYTKWYRGRATFFSREVFVAMLGKLLRHPSLTRSLSPNAKEILGILEIDSPLSTKALKRAAGLTGRLNEAAYSRALKELWSRLLIVGFGEVDEGAFPSLAMGASKILFEDLFEKAQGIDERKADQVLADVFAAEPLAAKFYERSLKSFEARPQAARRSVEFIEFDK